MRLHQCNDQPEGGKDSEIILIMEEGIVEELRKESPTKANKCIDFNFHKKKKGTYFYVLMVADMYN